MDKVLETKAITQIFGGLVALSNVSIEIKPCEIVGIIGPNGAGKTTLFNIITGIHRPTKGTVELLGKDITGKSSYLITRMGFARTFQNIRLFGRMTVMDNVLLGMHCRTRSGIADAILHTKRKKEEEIRCEKKARELLNLLDIFEHRLDLAKNLPYGSQRKLEIARALATDPILLLLDEPAAGMNEQESEELMGIILKLKGLGYTILLIEHHMRFVMNICERIYVLDHGVQIAHGCPADIKNNNLVIEAYLGKETD